MRVFSYPNILDQNPCSDDFFASFSACFCAFSAAFCAFCSACSASSNCLTSSSRILSRFSSISLLQPAVYWIDCTLIRAASKSLLAISVCTSSTNCCNCTSSFRDSLLSHANVIIKNRTIHNINVITNLLSMPSLFIFCAILYFSCSNCLSAILSSCSISFIRVLARYAALLCPFNSILYPQYLQ